MSTRGRSAVRTYGDGGWGAGAVGHFAIELAKAGGARVAAAAHQAVGGGAVGQVLVDVS